MNTRTLLRRGVLVTSTLALLYLPLLAPGDDAPASGDAAAVTSEEVIFLYTVNNLGYTDVCG